MDFSSQFSLNTYEHLINNLVENMSHLSKVTERQVDVFLSCLPQIDKKMYSLYFI